MRIVSALDEPSDEVLGGLWELASRPFTLAAFSAFWNQRAWSWDRTSSDEYGFQVSIQGHYPLWVDPLGSEILSARLPICYLDAFDGDSSPALTREEFDAAFHALKRRVLSLAGTPTLEWKDDNQNGYRATAWTVPNGVIIVQQAAFDPEFGDALCIWLDGMNPTELAPTTPLVDWLCARSRAAHDRHGFPALAPD